MDILENSIYNSVNGFVISENTYINKGKIYKVYTDEFGFISIYTKNSEMFLSLYSNYNFKLMFKNEFFYCNEYELIDFFSTQITASMSTIGLSFLKENDYSIVEGNELQIEEDLNTDGVGFKLCKK